MTLKPIFNILNLFDSIKLLHSLQLYILYVPRYLCKKQHIRKHDLKYGLHYLITILTNSQPLHVSDNDTIIIKN